MSRAGRRLSDEMHHIGYISDRLPRDDPARTLGSLGRAGILIGRKVYILEIDTQIEPI